MQKLLISLFVLYITAMILFVLYGLLSIIVYGDIVTYIAIGTILCVAFSEKGKTA